MVSDGRLPRAIQVFLDSPMAITATEIFRRHPECCRTRSPGSSATAAIRSTVPGLHLTRESADSMAINRIKGGAIIMAGSGMATGGRVRHHLKHNLWRQDAGIVFVGFAAHGTLARRIIDGAKRCASSARTSRSRPRSIRSAASRPMPTVTSCSPGSGASKAARTFLVHGEELTMKQFGEKLEGTEVVMPALHESFAL